MGYHYEELSFLHKACLDLLHCHDQVDKTRRRSFIADPVLNLEKDLGIFIRLSTSSFNYSFEILKQFLVYKIFKAIYLIDHHFKKKIVYDLTYFPEKLPIKKSIQPSFGQIWSNPLKIVIF